MEEKEKEQLLELDALKEVISELENDYDSILDQKKEYEKSLSGLLSPKESEEGKQSANNYLMVLRRWNSYTPAMLTDLESNVGGGYFINWKGKGIVIDPGFDFLDNFFKENLIIDNIDAVIITHAHIDHCNDFESLLTLIYEFNENIENQKNYRKKQLIKELNEAIKGKKKDELDNKFLNFNLFNYLISPLNENIEDPFSSKILKSYEKFIDKPYDERKKKIDVFMNLGSMKKYLGWIPIELGEGDDKINRVRPLEKGIEYELEEYDIKLKVVEAKHNEVLSKTYSCGLILELCDNINDKHSKSTKIGYTSDTKHVERIEDQFKGVDIIIPHLGSIDENDFNLMTKNRNSNHLMLKGVISTIYRSKAKIAIISEFGEELKGHKIKIVKALNKVFQSHQMARCLTGDVGLKVYIPELTINCFYESSSCDESERGIDKNLIIEELNPENELAEVIHFCKGCKNLYDDKKANS